MSVSKISKAQVSGERNEEKLIKYSWETVAGSVLMSGVDLVGVIRGERLRRSDLYGVFSVF